MRLPKLFGGEYPPTKKTDTEASGVDPRITFFDPTKPSSENVRQEGVIEKPEAVKIEDGKIIVPPEFKMGQEGLTRGVASEAVHREAFHIKPVMQGTMTVESPRSALAKPNVTVSFRENVPEQVSMSESGGVNSVERRSALNSLIQQAEDPNTPSHVRAHLQDQIIAAHGAGPENKEPSSDVTPSIAEIPSDGLASSEKPKVENPFKEGDELMEASTKPLSNEQKLAQLLQDVRTVPPKDRPAIMREIARLKKIEGKIAEDKEDIGNKIIRSRDVAATAQARKQILEARIADEKKKRTEAGQPEEGAHVTGLENRLKEATNTLVAAEQSYQDLTTRFLALGGTQDEIEALIAANSDEKPTEKPLVGEDEARKEELAAVAEEVADPVLDAMVAGTAVEALVATAEEEKAKENPQPASTEVRVAFEQIENLEEALEKARTAYVEADILNRSKIERLALHFPWLKNEKDVQKNPDLIQLREKYLAIRRAYQNQELKKIGNAPNEESLKKLLFESSFGEALSLDNEYQRALAENRGLGGKILAAYEGMGHWYNGLGWKKKVAVGGALFAGSIALGATGAGIGVPAIVWLRRFMAGSGSAIKLDAITEKWQEGANAKKIEKHLNNAVEQSQHLSPEKLVARLEAFLALNEDAIDQELVKRRKSRAKRKWGARLAGAFGGLAISSFITHEFHSETVKAAGIGAAATEHGLGNEVVSPEVSVNAPLDHSASQLVATEPVAPHEAIQHIARESVPTVTQTGGIETVSGVVNAGEFPAAHIVTAADSSKGLWGVLEKSLPVSMSEGDKQAHVAALERIIASKLAHMSPEMQAEYGFPGGNINVIHAGDTLQFNKLLTPEEWQNPLSVRVEDLPMSNTGVGEAVKASAEHVSRIDEHFLDGVEANSAVEKVVSGTADHVTGEPENLLEGVDIGGSNVLVEGMPEDPTQNVLKAGVDTMTFRESLQNFRLGVLGTPETANWLKYNPIGHAREMMQVPMGEIISAHESIILSGTYDTKLPFHESQIEKLHEMTTEAVKRYGASARPGKFETFERYTRRLIALGFQNTQKN